MQGVSFYHKVPQGYHNVPQIYHKDTTIYHKESVFLPHLGYSMDTNRNIEVSQGYPVANDT
jgi:hypothetical protein